MTQKKYHHLIFVLLLALIVLSLFSVMMGSSGFVSQHILVMKYRFFRVLLAIIAGSSLAASGASLQAMFRNPLADPHLFGISGGAALGACVVIASLSGQGTVLPSFGAIIGGSVAFLIIFYYVETAKDGPLGHCLLVGVLLNSLAASLITLLKTMLPMSKTQSLLFWLVGHITMVDSNDFLVIIPLWLIGMTALWLIKGKLEILSFGTDESQALGIDTNKIIKIAIVANCILIGNVVAFAGMIGFLGLVIPHLIRITIDANLRFMLPISALGGALCMVFFDSLSRISFLALQSEIPTGALSALLLSPVFFILLLKSSHD
jgi:iron complex transport system permease protein